MIITGLQNFITPNKTAKTQNTLLQSFTSKMQLNSDIFVPHDNNNPNQQYLNIYGPGKIKEYYYQNYNTYEKAIAELNAQSKLDYRWIQANSKLLKKVFGMDLPRNSATSELFLSELNSPNRSKIAQSILISYQRELEQYYKSVFPMFQNPPKARFKTFDSDALQAYNLAMTRLNYDQTVPENFTLFYRTTTPLPPLKKLEKQTNAKIIDMRKTLNNETFYPMFENLIKSVEETYKTNGQRSIILLKDMYKYVHFIEKNNAMYNGAMKFQDNYAAIFVTEDIPPSITTKTGSDKPKFANIPAYQDDKQRFITEILEPIKNNINPPQFVIFNNKTSSKDSREFLYAGLNEIDSNINTISHTTNINDFSQIINDIKTKVEQNNNQKTTFIVIPQAYKYIASNPENINLLKSLQKNNIIPILSSSYPDKLLDKMQIHNTSKQFTLNKLKETELEDLLKLYIDKADDEINSLITSGRDIQALDSDIDYKNLAALFNQSSYNGFKDIKDIVEKAKNEYLLSQKQTLSNYIFKFIAGGLNNEN